LRGKGPAFGVRKEGRLDSKGEKRNRFAVQTFAKFRKEKSSSVDIDQGIADGKRTRRCDKRAIFLLTSLSKKAQRSGHLCAQGEKKTDKGGGEAERSPRPRERKKKGLKSNSAGEGE